MSDSLRHYCTPGTTATQGMCAELRKLDVYIGEVVHEMRDLSPADLYLRLERLNRLAGYTLAEVADGMTALEKLSALKVAS